MSTIEFESAVRLYSVPKLISILGLSRECLRQMRLDGRLGFTKIGKRYFVRHCDLVHLLESNKVAASRPKANSRGGSQDAK
jgi:Helix-turn-helix domain